MQTIPTSPDAADGSDPARRCNAAALVLARARQTPDAPALIVPRTWDDVYVRDAQVVRFGELDARVARFAAGLTAQGIGVGSRVVVLFELGPDLFALILALAAVGASSVLIDPGMTAGRIRSALATARPDAIISVRKLLRLRPVIPELRRIPLAFCHDGPGRGLRPFAELLPTGPVPDVTCVDVDADHAAFLNFTSGSTGKPKGVVKAHGTLIGMHTALADLIGDADGDVALVTFATFALHHLSAGVPCVLAPFDAGKPGDASGAVVTRFAATWGVTLCASSPAFLRQVVAHTTATGERIPTLNRWFTGGAPVPDELLAETRRVWPDVRAEVVYGSTEAEPMAHASFADVQHADGEGLYVGHCVDVADVRVVRVDDPPPEPGRFDPDTATVGTGEVGELIVAGPHVVKEYFENPAAMRATKLRDAQGRIWHRTGDTGTRDADGGLRLTGRTSDVVMRNGRMLQPLGLEAAFIAEDAVARAALIAHAAAPVGEICVQVADGADRAAAVAAVSAVLATHDLADLDVVVVDDIPLDGRHNAKIDRPTLRRQRVSDMIAQHTPIPPAIAGHLPNGLAGRVASRLARRSAAAASPHGTTTATAGEPHA